MQWVGPASGSGLPLWMTGILALVVGALTGWIGLYLFGWLYRWVGSWMGGKASNAEVRAAIAWVEIPTFAVFAVWILVAILSPASVGAAPAAARPGALQAALGIVFGAVSFAAWMGSVVLACHTLGEVHGFSAWKGLGTLVIPNALLIVPLFLAGTMAALFVPMMPGARVRSPGVSVQAPQPAQEAGEPHPMFPEEPLLPAPTHPQAAREAAAAILRGLATAMEEYRARFGEYASSLQGLKDNGLLPEQPFSEVVGKGVLDGYEYALEKSAADFFSLRARRQDTVAAGSGVLTVDQNGTVLEDGQPFDSKTSVFAEAQNTAPSQE